MLRTRARGDERVFDLHEGGELEKLREDYPVFWDDETEKFIGPVSTNAIEGGNWRLKYELSGSVRARTSLLALRDSLSTFANGEPAESFAHRHDSFSFDQVLGESSRPPPPRENEQAAQAVA